MPRRTAADWLVGAAASVLLVRGHSASALRQQPSGETTTFVGAGDIANCSDLAPARATSRLLDGIEGTIFTLGDHAYKHGDAQEFRDCYGRTWGPYLDRTRPAVGNHDLITSHGRPYFDYFGVRAGPDRRGYYGYDLGKWHVVSLNSAVPLKSGSPQLEWLRDDLRSHRTDCTLAYWHVPLFSSSSENDKDLVELWRLLYGNGVDVVLNGHEHAYERFARQDPDGRRDEVHGIREFIVGTGGGTLMALKKIASNSEVHDDRTFGVLKLTLRSHEYAWEFVPIAGQRFHDAGSGRCNNSAD